MAIMRAGVIACSFSVLAEAVLSSVPKPTITMAEPGRVPTR
jgi:hypothetical protein